MNVTKVRQNRHAGVSIQLSDKMLKNGAGEAIRTPDPNLGKVVLYP